MHREREQVSVWLTGGGPFGLRLRGDGLREPLIVAKLHKKCKARTAGVRIGDEVLSINGNRCHGMSLQTANNLIDYSPDLSLQLLRFSDDQSHVTIASSSSSFRHHDQTPPRVRFLSPSPVQRESPPQTGTDVTELFRHQVYRPQMSPRLQQTTSGRLDLSDGSDLDHFVGSDMSDVDGMVTGDRYNQHQQQEKEKEEEEEIKTSIASSFTRKWQPGLSDVMPKTAPIPKITSSLAVESHKWKPTITIENDVDSKMEATTWMENLRQAPNRQMETSQMTQSEPPPSFLTKQTFTTKQKPERWQPPGAPQIKINEPEVEPMTSLKSGVSQPLDMFAHEVVIWSSRPTEVDRRETDSRDFVDHHRKPLPWQQPQQPEAKIEQRDAAVVGSLPGRPKLLPWQPSQKPPPVPAVEEPKDKPKQPSWQPSQPTGTAPAVAMTTGKTPWQPSLRQPSPAVFDSSATSMQSQPNRHRWQPTQLPVQGQEEEQANRARFLEEPERRSQDGSTSPVVTSLYLTRVVTDGSTIAPGSGSDDEGVRDSTIVDKKRLYGDSSFYEDPDHTYPTIEEQIKMARKVALLLTSPANRNARGQKMFLKRKEQSSKWIIDISNFLGPPPMTAPDLDQSKGFSPEEVERLRFHEEKSRHDVIPFGVCSMLAAELKEEKGRGGRLFAKRRDRVEALEFLESDGLIRVPDQPPGSEQPHRRYVPPENPQRIAAPPAVEDHHYHQVDGRADVSLPVNRLKGMADLPKPRMTPWDSEVQYGTVEPAFEHLKNYLPYGTAPEKSGFVDMGIGGPPIQQQSRRQETVGQNQVKTKDYSYKTDHIPDIREPAFGTMNYQHIESHHPTSGFAPPSGSSSFLRQAAADRKGYRPVRFEIGSRNFN